MGRFEQPISVFLLVFLLLLLRFKPALVVGQQQQQQQQQQVTVFSERIALIQLRSSLGLRAKEWPIKSDPCLNWRGIQCLNGSVVGINISGFRRTRIGSQNPQFAVDSLANLTNLASFNASFFALPGSIPDWFGQKLGNLSVLDLGSCGIQGSIPLSLGNLTRLTILVLAHNNLRGSIPSSLAQLGNLSILDLSHNSITGSIPDSFASLTNLSSLDISSNFVSGPIPPGIGLLSNLRSLNFSNNSLDSGVPPQLGDLRGLVDLDLGVNALSGTLSSELNGLKNLKTMVLGSNNLFGPLPDGLFPGLTHLQVVVLSHNNFSGVIPNALFTMPTLQLVDVSDNNFTGTLPNIPVSTNVTTTAVFNLSDNEYYGELTPTLQRFNLIDLSGNYFEGKVPDTLQGKSSSLGHNCLQNATYQRTQDDCASFYASKGLVFDNFGLPSTSASPPSGPPPKKTHHKRTILLAAILGGVGLLLLLLLLLLLIVCLRRKGGMRQRGNGVGPIPPTAAGPTSSPGTGLNFASLGESFTYQQLLQATDSFSDANLIKNGHSGDLFRGLLEGGIPVVIKRVNLNSVKQDSYLIELDFLSKVSHPRLVPLLGHCLEQENEKYLVYKFMPNGDLSSALYRKVNPDDDSLQSLDWITRLKIAIGAAEGLCYLHHECTPPFVHRDVQASSILLDDKFEVRLGSLSEVCIQEGETQPGVITRLLRLPQTSEQGTSGGSHTSTCAYDVYCFGKVLLELVTGKLGISASNDASTKEFIDQVFPYITIQDKELVTKIVDPTLIYDEDLLEEVWAMAIVARSCLHPKPSRRPHMTHILKALESPLRVVREDNNAGSARLRTTSSRSSWNAYIFGSWRQSLDVGPTAAAATSAAAGEGPVGGTGSLKRSGTSGSHSQSQGSGHITGGGGGTRSSSQRQQSREIFPEPMMEEVRDIERQGDE